MLIPNHILSLRYEAKLPQGEWLRDTLPVKRG